MMNCKKIKPMPSPHQRHFLKGTEMPAYNFQARFAPLVESGQKRQTIRRTAKCAMPGATAYLYTGQRTEHCRKIGEGTITDVLRIEIGRHACSEPYADLIRRKRND